MWKKWIDWSQCKEWIGREEKGEKRRREKRK